MMAAQNEYHGEGGNLYGLASTVDSIWFVFSAAYGE